MTPRRTRAVPLKGTQKRGRGNIWGLTGSIGMGKSAVAAMLRRQGVPLFDADAEVHRLQGANGALLPAIEARFPGTTGPQGLDRARLGTMVFGKPDALRALERIVHPEVGRLRKRFLRRYGGRPLVFLDIPLLFEKGGDRRLAGVVTLSAPAWKQRRRVLARTGMTPAKFRQIVRLQTPDAEKRRLSTYIIDTGGTFDRSRAQVRRLIACLSRMRGG